MAKVKWWKRVINRAAAHWWAARHRSWLHPLSTNRFWVGISKSNYTHPRLYHSKDPELPTKNLAYTVKQRRDGRIVSTVRGDRWKRSDFEKEQLKHEFGHVIQAAWNYRHLPQIGFEVDYNSEYGLLQEEVIRLFGYGEERAFSRFAPAFSSFKDPLPSKDMQFFEPVVVLYAAERIFSKKKFQRAVRRMFLDPSLRKTFSEMNENPRFDQDSEILNVVPLRVKWSRAFYLFFQEYDRKHPGNNRNITARSLHP